jgi:hypothetical protein
MLSNPDIIKRLWELGHFFNPNFFDPDEIKETDLSKLDIEDEEVTRALRSWQDMMAPEVDFLSMKHHGRPAIHDGEFGPALQESFEIPRCGHPDYFPDTIKDGDLFGAGYGSWHEECARDTGVTFSVNPSGQPAGTKANWDEILRDVVDAYRKVGIKLREVSSSSANIAVSWRSLGGGTIGLASLHAGTCNKTGFCYLSTSYNAAVVYIKQLLCHEWGHNMNLGHTRGGIMHPSIGNVSGFTGWMENDPSYPKLRKFFPWGPLPGPGPDPKPDPDPDPVPPPVTDLKVEGAIDVKVNGRTAFRIIPVPGA